MPYDAATISGAGIVNSDYARRTRHLMKLINDLRGVGWVKEIVMPINTAWLSPFRAHADIDLPRIAVIGNQSAGKSSLVEAISGVRIACQ